MTSYLGIDPGLDGGFAVITDNHVSLKLAMPTSSKKLQGNKTKRYINRSSVMNFLNALPVATFIAIEEQIPVRNQSVTSVFTTAKNYGILLMAISASVFGFSPLEVPSSRWHALFGIVSEPKAGKSTKAQAFEIASAIFPNTNFRQSNRARTPHDGIVDATLIAHYCQLSQQEKREEKE
jgi:Holliday junction resolvasome RuvABC endonuclease subunit